MSNKEKATREIIHDQLVRDPQIAEEVLQLNQTTSHQIPSFLQKQEGEVAEESKPASKKKLDALISTLESTSKPD